MANDRITESTSNHDNLEQLSIKQIIEGINQEDQSVPTAISKELDNIERLIVKATGQLKKGGRLFYMGAGTSGRLGIVDASECPPTFGVDHNLVIGIIAGGDSAIRKAVEFAEDDTHQGWEDLQEYKINSNDFVIGIAASGTTPYVIGALETCQKNNIPTGCIACNPNSPLSKVSDHPIEVLVGPEFVTGSTRMKSGTAQKLVLNMISTACMIQLGRVKGNRMVDMQLSNNKLVDRGTKMVMEGLGVGYEQANKLLNKYGSVRSAIAAKRL
ncbi:N-acetylmuramic acid 6-phosphate etherase [Salibacteraceae bacterium]|nr:N-acetylmuramic acid 6-phosphate etherase [Crocinitomicaceae bacterium]MDB9725206.1 N-acetylmuramic acid 6-phosphate etherase [Salibacteraceae bacterium]MDC1204253.1 N-acetylmuramic acid 6-phosphate etherase [Salibacteraceae bacterium]|tara:strand:+ start:117538 stop:118350 length:813 start_codon:yes stop_codon:yes gene_type:complete